MKRFSFLRAADFVTIMFVAPLSMLEISFASRVETWSLFVPLNIALCFFIFFSARYVKVHGRERNYLLTVLRDWYLVPCILYVYTQASSVTHLIHGRDYDSVLIMIDRALFGVDPTHWISQFAHPLITEFLQIVYSSYYLFFIFLFYEMNRRSDHTDFQTGTMLVVYGFYLSYVGYLLFPAIGPRFTLHDYFATELELPGIFLTKYLRAVIDSGGGIPLGSVHPVEFVHRDAFPSGHTQLTLVAMYVAYSFKTKFRWWLFVGGSLLIISTVYLRYHYVIDVLVGSLFFLFTIWSGKRINEWWNKGIKNV